MRVLTAIPVYNEAKSVREVLAAARRYAPEILVVNDGSTDGTAALLDAEAGIYRIDHPKNRGYGAALISSFTYALTQGYDVLVTMDCDGQHEPSRIPLLLEALAGYDIVSGSRYLRDFRQNTPAPTDRRYINAIITQELNRRFGLQLTDAFCGFKAYRCEAGRACGLRRWDGVCLCNSGCKRRDWDCVSGKLLFRASILTPAGPLVER